MPGRRSALSLGEAREQQFPRAPTGRGRGRARGKGPHWADRYVEYCYAMGSYGEPCGTDPGCCGTIAPDCSGTSACGLTYDGKIMFQKDPNYRKAYTRHMGGCNLGFLDGHAKRYMSETMLWQSPPARNAIFEGMCHCPCRWTANYCVNGDPV